MGKQLKSTFNTEIEKSLVRIVSSGKYDGDYTRREAVLLSRDIELDLIQVNISGDTSICKVLDVNKTKYEQKKREKGNKKRKTSGEITFKYQTDTNDLKHKSNDVIRLLKKGQVVTITVQMMGREAGSFEEIGRNKLQEALEMVKEKSIEKGMNIKINPVKIKNKGRNKDIFTVVQIDNDKGKNEGSNRVHK